MLLIFLGAPGSGKGTISQDMVDNYGYKHISTGNIFRKIIIDKTELGLKVKSIIESGKLVDDEITWEVAKAALESVNLNTENIILDGYPRNIDQSKYLEKWIKEKGFENFKSIYYKVPEEEILKRLTGRLLCKDCGRSFNINSKIPKKEGKCDFCDGILYQREDDKIQNVRVRLDTYKKITEPLIEYFNKKGCLITIDGMLLNATELTIKEI